MAVKKSYISRHPGGNKLSVVIDGGSNNTILFENHSRIEEFCNPDIPTYDKTESGLFMFDDVILEQLMPLVRASAKPVSINVDTAKRYDMNPYLFSQEQFGNPDLWWLILAANGYMSVTDFTMLPDKLLVPELEVLRSAIKNIFEKDQSIGTITTYG